MEIESNELAYSSDSGNEGGFAVAWLRGLQQILELAQCPGAFQEACMRFVTSSPCPEAPDDPK